MSDIARSFQFKSGTKSQEVQDRKDDSVNILITGAVCQYAPAATNELEAQRRDICAQHALQAPQ
jgi:hypothetical protein